MLTWVMKSLKVKLILMFICVIVVVVASIGLFSYQEISRTIKDDTVRYSSQILKQANLNLERYYREYEQGFLLLGSSEEFEKWTQKTTYDSLTELRLIKDNYILPFQFRHPEIMSITLKSELGGEINYTGSRYGFKLGYTIDQEPWIQQLRFSEKVFIRVGMSRYYVDRAGRTEELMVMTLAKQFGTTAYPGILKMDISLEPAQSILKELELGEHSVGLIADTEGKVIVHPDTDRINEELRADLAERIYSGESRGSFYVEETDEIVVFDTIPYTGWKTIATIHYPSIADSAHRLKNATILFAAGGIAFAVLLIIPLTTSITRRISNVRRMMERMRLGEFKHRVVIKGSDELADLGRSYNEMLDDLEQAVHKLTETKVKQQRAVMSALQSQINSHFLYNTLESINSMAVLADHREIEQTITNLSNMLRYISTYSDVIVPIGEELKHVENYLQICSIRYGDELSYEIDIEDGCADLPCLKAILQPIVENAIKHGLETSGENIHLRIAVRRHERFAVMSVEDNGGGFSPETLARLAAELAEADRHEEALETMTHVGIPNVLYRLKMFYKDEPAGISVENIEPHGAKVTIQFPAATKEGPAKEHEPNSDR